MQKQQDDALLAAFHLMDDEERSFYLEAFQLHTAGRTSKKPSLTLVISNSATMASDCPLSRRLG